MSAKHRRLRPTEVIRPEARRPAVGGAWQRPRVFSWRGSGGAEEPAEARSNQTRPMNTHCWAAWFRPGGAEGASSIKVPILWWPVVVLGEIPRWELQPAPRSSTCRCQVLGSELPLVLRLVPRRPSAGHWSLVLPSSWDLWIPV